jgi:ERCC4-type nuclease
MRTAAWELELPIDDGGAGEMAQRRLGHLAAVAGVDQELVPRLARAFRSLRAVYEASETELARHVGPVAAARIRWFLDAPLDTRLAAETAPARAQSLPHAA